MKYPMVTVRVTVEGPPERGDPCPDRPEPTDPASQTRPPPWMTARSIAAGIASTRRLVMQLAGNPDRPFLDKLERDEDRLVRLARGAGLVLGPVRPR